MRRAEPLGPVIDRSRDRVARGEFGEAERDHQLTGKDEWPRPPIRRAAEREPKVEQLKGAGEDRNVADPGGKRGEAAERTVQLLLVAELGQVGVVACAWITRRAHANPLSSLDGIANFTPVPAIPDANDNISTGKSSLALNIEPPSHRPCAH